MPIRLGIDTYSIRAFNWKVPRLLDYAAEQKVDAIQASVSAFERLDAEYLQSVKDHATRVGVALEPGFGCICPLSKEWKQGDPVKYLQEAVRVAKALGSPCVRVFIGGAADRQGGVSIPSLIESSVKLLKSIRSQAVDAGVKIAVENHGDMQAREARQLIEEAGQDFVGSCLDSGNPVNVLEDPHLTLEVLGPYAVTTHIRDSVVFEHPRGIATQWVAMGDGVVDWPRFVTRFAELCPNSPFHLEIITGRPPQVFPYLEQGFWKMFPDTPAQDFARFLALAKKGGPFMGTMVVTDGVKSPPPEYAAALREQQRVDLERSLRFARSVGVSVRN